MSTPTPARRFRPWIGVVTLLVGVVACGALWWSSPAGRQWRNMRRAEAFLARVEPGLAADPRFSRLEFIVSTSEQILVRGHVADEGVLEALAERLRAENPPCPVNLIEAFVDDGSRVMSRPLVPAKE